MGGALGLSAEFEGAEFARTLGAVGGDEGGVVTATASSFAACSSVISAPLPSP